MVDCPVSFLGGMFLAVLDLRELKFSLNSVCTCNVRADTEPFVRAAHRVQPSQGLATVLHRHKIYEIQ